MDSLVIQSTDRYNPGDRIVINHFDSKIVNQPAIIVREASAQEYMECCKKLGVSQWITYPYFYEVSTD